MKLAVPALSVVLVLFMAWLGGVDFGHRNEELFCAVLLAAVCGAILFAMTLKESSQ